MRGAGADAGSQREVSHKAPATGNANTAPATPNAVIQPACGCSQIHSGDSTIKPIAVPLVTTA
ncbi:hypothetical protein D3C72_1411960 [compost metagenome]